MENDQQAEVTYTNSEENDKYNFVVGITIVLIVGIIFAAFTIFSGSLINESGQANTAASINSKAAKKENSGSVWAGLQEKGLQGAHYTLNIHGKKDDFNKEDCEAPMNPETGTYSYGNNIFIPAGGDNAENNQIVMVSGNKKGKWATTVETVFGVKDACTAPIDEDEAELIIPPSEKGYYVTARVLGKPTDDPSLTINGDLVFVEDEFGNDLLVLGLVTDNGFETPQQTVTRTKGKVSATDITGLFEWSGDVCYLDGTNYCTDESGANTCSLTSLCCNFSDVNVIDSCTDPVLVDGALSCEVGTLTDLSCNNYLNEWVFNIGDMVGYLWNVNSSSENFKLANIRFYPVQ